MARVKTHPGRVLRAELEVRDMSADSLASAIRVPVGRITAILRGERPVTVEMAGRMGRYLGTGADFWMNLQSAHDISVAESEKGRVIEGEAPAAAT